MANINVNNYSYQALCDQRAALINERNAICLAFGEEFVPADLDETLQKVLEEINKKEDLRNRKERLIRATYDIARDCGFVRIVDISDDDDFYLSGKINHATEKKEHGVVFSVCPEVSVITVRVRSGESFERFFSLNTEEKKIFNMRSDIRTSISKFGVDNGLSNIDIAELYYMYNQIIDYLKSRGFEIEFPKFGM